MREFKPLFYEVLHRLALQKRRFMPEPGDMALNFHPENYMEILDQLTPADLTDARYRHPMLMNALLLESVVVPVDVAVLVDKSFLVIANINLATGEFSTQAPDD